MRYDLSLESSGAVAERTTHSHTFLEVRMNQKTRSLLALGLVVIAAAFAAGCQTVQGAGKDIQYVGERTEEVIKK